MDDRRRIIATAALALPVLRGRMRLHWYRHKLLQISWCTAVTLALGVSSASAATVLIQSGNGPVGGLDASVLVVTQNGQTVEPHPASIVATHPAWFMPLGSSRWVSYFAGGGDEQGGYAAAFFDAPETTYETTFTLPAGATAPSLSVTLSADNRGRVSLNGNVLGGQEGCYGFQSRDTFSTTTGFVTGTNTISFDVDNPGDCLAGPTGLTFVATVTYDGDGDGDGVADSEDNCPETANRGQADADGDGIGAACDAQELPLSAADCKKGGWRHFDGTATFRNQGRCMSFVATAAKRAPK